MKILITGANGQLGSEMRLLARHSNHEFIFTDVNQVEFLGCTWECLPQEGLNAGDKVKVEVDFENVNLQDNEEDGVLSGDVKFILYKGNHYHLTVLTDWDEDIYVDTHDVWDDGDRVGISIAPEHIRLNKL